MNADQEFSRSQRRDVERSFFRRQQLLDASLLLGRNQELVSIATGIAKDRIGNPAAPATVRVPTPQEGQRRIESRQREQLKREVQRVAAQGRGLLLTQGHREKKGWWEEKRWERLHARL